MENVCKNCGSKSIEDGQLVETDLTTVLERAQ